MKKLLLTLLILALAAPAALAERLTLTINDFLSVDAERPSVIPDELPLIKAKFNKLDVERVEATLALGGLTRVADSDGYIYGNSESGAYALVNANNGRVFYESAYFSDYFSLVLRLDDEMTDCSLHFPTDLDLDFMSRGEALAKAKEVLGEFGVSIAGDMRIYTIEPKSYGRFLAEVKKYDMQASIHRRKLEPMDPTHAGYFIVFEPGLDGYPVDLGGGAHPGGIMITAQGIEYLETGYTFAGVKRSKPKKTLSPEQALKKAGKSLKKVGNWTFNEQTEKVEPVGTVVERVRLIYYTEYDEKGMTFRPLWMFEFVRSVSTRGAHFGTDAPADVSWRDRTPETNVNLFEFFLNAYTGKLVDLGRL